MKRQTKTGPTWSGSTKVGENQMSDLMIWVFLMVVFIAGMATGYAFSVEGGETAGVVQLVFSAIVLGVVAVSRRQKSE